VIQIQTEKDEEIKINLSEEQLKSSYKELEPVLKGPLFESLTKLLKYIVKIGIVIPSDDFKTKENHDGIRCSAKANDGHLYPLKNSLIFIHKPVIYIRNKDIKYVEFSRVDLHRNSNWRSFDIEISRIESSTSESGKVNFVGLDKEEYELMVQYL